MEIEIFDFAILYKRLPFKRRKRQVVHFYFLKQKRRFKAIQLLAKISTNGVMKITYMPPSLEYFQYA